LAGYYVSEGPLAESDILASLHEHLPEYMVPTALIHLKSLPLTVNGKLDRKALPEPDLRHKEAYRAPENLLQSELCAIYSDLLGVKVSDIGIDDDFFHLGGSSILAIRLLSRVHKQFNVPLTVTDVFIEKTVCKLAARISTAGQDRSLLVKLSNEAAPENLFMIHPGNAGCEVYLPLAKRLEGVFNCYGVDSYNLYHLDVISSLPKMAEAYLALIHQKQRDSGHPTYHLLGWSLGGQLALEIAAILENTGVKDIRLYLLDTIINDDRLDSLNGELTQEELSYVSSQIGNILGSTENCRRYLVAQRDLIRQRISRRLRHTRVTQFKAMLPDAVIPTEDAKLTTAHVLTLQANNVELCLESPQEQLQVVRLENADHYNLLKEAEETLFSKIVETNP
jgi:thioesterase domain-containing protein